MSISIKVIDNTLALLLPPDVVNHLHLTATTTTVSYVLLPDGTLVLGGANTLLASIEEAISSLDLNHPAWNENLPKQRVDLQKLWGKVPVGKKPVGKKPVGKKTSGKKASGAKARVVKKRPAKKVLSKKAPLKKNTKAKQKKSSRR